ncbi:amino acid ABC transporter substrate-binding protein [Inediibacterium massiliense]|uniref:amino acid ABC transporter substrate-binding protein n=1 Tax=Inediibacterium massiliense TaxID=1658111 RepID=UPI0006B4A8C7|nr:amino acid ABC transporter substrate-binding protein [Inediibacterium massiliense]
MKKQYLFLLMGIMLVTFVFAGCSQQASTQQDQSLQGIKDNGKFVLGLDDSFPPMGFRDEKGEIVGFDIDLAKEVAKRMGVELEVKPIDWDGKVLSLNNQDIDVIWNGLTVTPERKEQILFSKDYLKNRQIVIVNKDSNIENKKDLTNKVVAVQLGSSGEDALNADEKTSKAIKEIRKFSNYTEALLDLKAGRVDAVVIDEVVGRYYMGKREGEYKIAKEDFGEEGYAIGFRKNDISFQQEVDKILDEMKKDGTTGEISKKWFGKDIVSK